MKKILWISPYVPSDNVSHAGGKNERYYIEILSKAIPDGDICLLSFGSTQDISQVNLPENVKLDLSVYDHDFRSSIKRALVYNCLWSKYSPFDKYGNLVSNYWIKVIKTKIRNLLAKQWIPDIIILQWTEIVVLIDIIKKTFPKTPIISVEEDVAYLGYKRHVDFSHNKEKIVWKNRYKRLKKSEILSLRLADAIICSNYKDKNILLAEGIDNCKLFTWAPYHYDFSNLEHKKNNNIVFYGSMDRSENYLSAIWFINNCMDKLPEKYQFLIVGGNPNPELRKYESERVHVLGYVDSIEEYLSESFCLVAPLVLGAGIKIKILESMSAGVPVLTNDIGIEGINARDGYDYINCKSSLEYIRAINQLEEYPDLYRTISENGRNLVIRDFDYTKSAHFFVKLVKQFIQYESF